MSGAAGVSAGGAAGSVAVAAGARSQNGEVDYKKVRNFVKKKWGNCSALLLNMFRFSQLWEESQKENNRLRDELGKLKDDLGATKRKLDTAIHVRRCFPFLFFYTSVRIGKKTFRIQFGKGGEERGFECTFAPPKFDPLLALLGGRRRCIFPPPPPCIISWF